MFDIDPWNIRQEDVEKWKPLQLVFAGEIFYTSIVPCIKKISPSDKIGDQLIVFTKELIRLTFRDMMDGNGENPFHHHFQVLQNALRAIAYECKEGLDAHEIKKYIILAYTHDIGDGEVARKSVKAKESDGPDAKVVRKVKSSELKDAKKKLDEAIEEKSDEEPELKKALEDLVKMAIAFRKQHMEEGEEQVRTLFTSKWPEEEPQELEEICKTISIHDNPTIAFILNEYGEYIEESGSEDAEEKEDAEENIVFILNEYEEYIKKSDSEDAGENIKFIRNEFGEYIKKSGSEDAEKRVKCYLFLKQEHELAAKLREWDRMWMISKYGVVKDLMDKLVKGETPKPVKDQLSGNLKRFEDERKLYDNEEAEQTMFVKDGIFFRSEGSLKVFEKHLAYWKEQYEELIGYFWKY